MATTYKKFSNVSFMPAVTGVSRKLALRREKCYNVTIPRGNGVGIALPGKTYMGVVTKEVGILGHGTVTKCTLFMRTPMNRPADTTAQLEHRNAFTAGIMWANAAIKDLAVLAQNQQKFLEARQDLSKRIEGISVLGYQSFRGWMQGIAIALAKADKLPQNHLLPAWDE